MKNLQLKTLSFFIIPLLFSATAFAYNCNTLHPDLNNPIKYSEETILFALSNKKRDAIEGVYKSTTQNQRQQHRIAILKTSPEGYLVFFLSGGSGYLDWVEGDELGYIPISSKLKGANMYSNLSWHRSNRTLNTSAHLAFSDNNDINLTLSFSDNSSITRYVREDFQINMSDTPNHTISAGTGFALSKNGYLATNKHVIKGGKTFKAIQYEAGIPVEYSAELVYVDPENDIAILKITDKKFEPLDNIPYSISNTPIQQGFKVYTLGYPLVETLGTEAKLRTGLISSSMGYNDYDKAYGTNIELLPGNSGGPLFSAYGNLEGIVYSRFSQHNNQTYTVGYAIKSQVLIETIQKTRLPIQLPRGNRIMHLPLTEQVKELKPFIFHIGVYK